MPAGVGEEARAVARGVQPVDHREGELRQLGRPPAVGEAGRLAPLAEELGEAERAEAVARGEEGGTLGGRNREQLVRQGRSLRLLALGDAEAGLQPAEDGVDRLAVAPLRRAPGEEAAEPGAAAVRRV